MPDASTQRGPDTRVRRGVAVALVLVALTVAVLLRRDRSADDAPAEVIDAPAQEIAAVRRNTPPSASGASASPALEAAAADCLTPNQLFNDASFRRDVERVNAVLAYGRYARQYEGIDTAGLRSLADQGDTAAMLLLGRRLQLEAVGISPAFAVASLASNSRETMQALAPLADPGQLDSPERVARMREAREWFYRAALNDRLYALLLVGEADFLLGQGPVEQGWIDASEFRELGDNTRRNMLPQRVYLAAIPYIAPELDSGLTEGLVATPEPRVVQVIAATLAERYDRDRAAAALPPLEIERSEVSDLEAYEARICEPYREIWLEELP